MYSRLEPGGVSTATFSSLLSLSGANPKPPKVICSAIAATNDTIAKPIIAAR